MANRQRGRRPHGRMGRRAFLRLAALMGGGLTAAVACRGSEEGPLTTTDGTIAQAADGSLVLGPGEPHTVRTELAQAQADRARRRRSLAVFHHLTDFRIVDEESPLRSEWLESCPRPLSTSAFRPQESLSLQAADAMIARANRIDRSQVTGRRVDFAFHTGNAADNAQYNELRAFLDLLDGKTVHPDSGSPGYSGAQKESPEAAYPDLLVAAQKEFVSAGLAYPWYAAVGNRDVLIQANFPVTAAATTIAVGSEKIISLGPQARAEVCESSQSLLEPDASGRVVNDPDSVVQNVSPDPERRPLSKVEWLEEHFNTQARPGPAGHGFSAGNVAAGSAYYVLDHGPIRFIVLDTVNYGGFAAGSMDAAQFAWLEEQLKAASSSYFGKGAGRVSTGNQDRLIVIVSHHGADAMTNPFPGPAGEQRLRGTDLEALLHRFPNVMLHVAGHSLEHRITARPDASGATKGYWQITTASPLDYPMQSRLLEIADNGDGTLSIFSTTYDTAAPLAPGAAKDPTPDEDGVNQRLLASTARRVGMGDPQLNRQATGLSASDRNAELLLPAPFALAAVPTPARHEPAGDPSGRS
ncbi:MAG: TIGR03767 family metallophosphoesterase [Dehalococcoidia bacterium]|nr:TIGR03767 family metallophosphoesterase [Dehalococcoidia bacterium]